MLPFLKLKQHGVAGLIIKNRTPDEHKAEGGDIKEDSSAGHLACAADLLKAVENKDVRGIADALYDAFTLMDSEPHKEGEHTEESPHTYEAQNRKAAE